ncbi:MAG TPA: carbohydrate kinase family protein [Kineosporiaceae bacterium]|nr:carbohydrate kinase family protein [Kineosporiaceae bacterium]
MTGTGSERTRTGVICVGSVVVDVAKVIDFYPPIERLAMIEDISLGTGGPGLNLAVDLRQLGAHFPVTMVGAVGDDEHGAFALAECVRLDIGTRDVVTLPGVATSFTDAMIVRDGGRRTFFHHIGANALLDPSGMNLAGSTAKILHAGAPGIHPMLDAPVPDGGNGWSTLLRRAQQAGLQTNLELVTLDPAKVRAVALPCLPHLDSIVINELEAASLSGIEAPVADADGPVDWTALEASALRLIELGVSRLAVVHFPAGCVAAAPGGRTWRQGSVKVPPEEIRNTTGAGDAFAAGVLLGLHDDQPVEHCLQLGASAAALCVRSPKTSQGIPPATSCLAYAARVGYRATV